MANQKQTASPRIAIAHPGTGAYSETFIRDHISRMEGVAVVFHKGFFPEWIDGKPLFPKIYSWMEKVARVISPSFQSIVAKLKSRKIAGILRKKGIGIILAEYGPTGVEWFPIAQRTGIPLVVHFHGQDAFHHPMLAKYSSAYRQMLPNIAGVIVGTDEMSRQLQALGTPQEKIFKNPCGVDTKLFQPIDPSANPPHFVGLGRFVEKKAPHLSILAFARMAADIPEARLTMIGDGPLLDACKQLARALNLEDRIEFTGAIAQEAIPPIMQKSRAYIQHSAIPASGDSEGTSISVLEAAASGLPVISTRHGGIKDSVLHEKTGFLSDEYDIDSMARYMKLLAMQPEKARQMGQAGRERMESAYAMEKSIGNLYNILLTAFQKSRNASV